MARVASRKGSFFPSLACVRPVTGSDTLGAPGPNPREAVVSLLSRARSLQQQHDATLRNFIGKGKWAQIIDTVADLDGLPQDLVGAWEKTAEYSYFVLQFGSLFDECSTSLSAIVGPGGKPVARQLRTVAGAVRLETRFRRLIQCLETASTEDLRFRTETKVRRTGRSRTRDSRAAPSGQDELGYGVLSMMLTILALCLTVSIATLGLSLGVYIGAGTGVVGMVTSWATRHWWVPGLARAFSRDRR